MPTFRHGRGTRVLFGAYELSTMLRSANVSAAADTAETTAFLSSVKTYVMGIPGATVALEGMFSKNDVTNADIDNVFNAAFGQEAPTPVTIGFDSGFSAGSRVTVGAGYESSYNISGSVTDMVAVTADIQASGGMSPGVSLLDTTPTINPSAYLGTSVDLAVLGAGLAVATWPNNMRLLANLHKLSGTVVGDTITGRIEHSINNSVWTTLATFPVITGLVNTTSVAIPAATPLNRYVRFASTGTGVSSCHANMCYFLSEDVAP